MKRKALFHLLVTGILFVLLTGLSCKKKEGRNSPSFTWTFEGVTYTADDATAYTNDIEAVKTIGSEIRHVEVALHSANDFPVGTHTMGTGANIIGTWNGATPSGGGLFSMSGTLTITASSPDEISGNFNVVMSTGTGSLMTGTFSHVPLE